MKKNITRLTILLLCAFVGNSATLFGQDITLQRTTVSVAGLPNDTNIPAITHIQNNTAGDIDLTWVRENVQIPSAWRTAVCDIDLCSNESVSSKIFTLMPTPANTDGGLLELQFRPNGQSGSGSCELGVYLAGTTVEAARGFFNATATVIATTNIQKNRVQIYPNPAVEYLTISGNDEVATLKLYTALGVLAKQFSVLNQNTQYNISDLQAGAYLLTLLDANGNILQVSSITKGL